MRFGAKLSSAIKKQGLNITHTPTVTTLSVHAIIQSFNHVAVAQCRKSCRYRPRVSFNVPIQHHDKEKINLSDCGMVVGPRHACLSVSETNDLLEI